MYESAESGIFPLMVIPRTTQKTEEDIRREEAEAESQVTRTQVEALQMKKIRSKAPTKKLVGIKGNASYICCIVVGIVWRCVPTVCLNL